MSSFIFLCLSMRQLRYSFFRIANAPRWRTGSAAFFLLAMWALGGSKVSGAQRIWSGTVSTDFELGVNWGAVNPPVDDTTTDIGVFSIPVTVNQPTLTKKRSINGLQFTTASGGWILGGAFTLSLGSGGIDTNGQTSGTNTISPNLQLAAASPWLVGTSGTLLVGGQVSSTGAFGLTLNNGSNAGTLKLNGANTYTGSTTINAGTLNAGAAGSIGGTSNIVVNAGGTLLLSQPGSATNDRINNSSAMTLNGGTFNTGGLSEHNLSGTTVTPGIAALTVSSNSVINLGAGASVLAFTGSNAQTWTATLSIYNWSGTPVTGHGTDQLYFGTDATGLTATQLSQIAFYSDSGTTFLGTAGYASGMDGEIVPVSEPATWFAAALAFGGLGFTQRRRIGRLRNRGTYFATRCAELVVYDDHPSA